MMSFLLIRRQQPQDTPQISELVRNGYISNVSNIFWGTIFNECTLQITVIIIAILFIFFQISLFKCILVVPIIFMLILIIIYLKITMKSAQIMYDKKAESAWVAEIFEPYFSNEDQQNTKYFIIYEESLQYVKEKVQGRKKIIGTIAVMKHAQKPELAWLYRTVVDKKYRKKGVAFELVKIAQKWCKENHINKIELAISEYNSGARQLFDKTGFEIKQLYHKKEFLNFYTVQMFLLAAEVRPTFSC